MFLWVLILLSCALTSVVQVTDGIGSKRVRRIVGGLPADILKFEEPVVYLNRGARSAKVRGVLEHPHYAFKGLRYAYSPTGRDRFRVSQFDTFTRREHSTL